jgi:hypothetical protein
VVLIEQGGGGGAQVFRATDGRALVWGKPPRIIMAQYITADGVRKNSLLLASGMLPPRGGRGRCGEMEEKSRWK